VVGEPLVHDANEGPTRGSFAADLDADGYPELITFHFNYWQGDVASPVNIFAGTPSTHLFRPRTSRFIAGAIPRLVHPSSFLAADLNDDGITDLFLGGSGFDQPPFEGERDWLLLSRPGEKHVGKVAPARGETFTHTSAVGDIDRDGVLDIYVGGICCGQGPYFLMGRRGLPPVGSYQRLHTTVANRIGNFFTAAALVDIDGKKGVDLVLASGGYDDTGNVVYLNDGTGHFLSAAPDLVLPMGLFGPQTITVEVVAADVNSDGRPDLILSQTDNDPFYTGYGLQILIGGKNGFVDRTDVLLPRGVAYRENGAWRGAVYLADFYGDGIVDFVASGFYSNDVSDSLIWINDGSGKFHAQPRKFFDKEMTYPDSVNIIPLDLNHDRRSDVAWLTPRLTPRGLTETVVRT
jgi:FG-GAP-like repeat